MRADVRTMSVDGRTKRTSGYWFWSKNVHYDNSALLSTSSIISAFMYGSPPSEVDFVYVGFNHKRAGRQAWCLRSHFIIVHCGCNKALLLGFQCLECWVSGLRLLTLKIWDLYVVIFLPYTSWNHVGSFRIVGYWKYSSGLCGAKLR